MEAKPVGAVAVTRKRWPLMAALALLLMGNPFAREGWAQMTDNPYQKRALDAAEVDLLFSYYKQDGQHAAVTGGEGTEALTDASSSLVVRMPLGERDILTVDVGISAYTSASSSNVNPLDGGAVATPYEASSGASRKDMLTYIGPSYLHNSRDGNTTWGANAYFSTEYDYYSLGVGGSYSRRFNQGNTGLTLSGRVFWDKWNPRYPIELRPGFFDDRIRGNGTYAPLFVPFDRETRNSYALSLELSQLLGQKLQGALFVDLVLQHGLLSTPFQRVHFQALEAFYLDLFQLADDVERLPEGRLKLPIGGRLNYYLNDFMVLRTYYRYYWDDWGVSAHTGSLEVPLKLGGGFSLAPNYRLHTQSAADYFYPKEVARSTFGYYTSDHDLSQYVAHQYGLGLQYRDIMDSVRLLSFGLKSVDLRFAHYDRSDGLQALIVSVGTTFVGN